MYAPSIRCAVGSVVVSLLSAYCLAQETPQERLPETIQFNRDIRPILSERCFTCHGPDRGRRVTTFHFDVEEYAKQDLGGGRFAIAPGDVTNSLLIKRVTAPGDGARMPPASTGPRLSDREVALLARWIEQGAKWEKHWSFEPPRRPAVPKVAAATWIRNPIDNFVLQRLEREGLKPSPEADRATLLRRVTLDLTGKGPATAELDAFLADKSSNAYEKVVDRLIGMPQYGERMALPWLDAARYADTNGYQEDFERSMWRWRDCVIGAFNKNMPFDQFTIEQLAGDLLPNPTLDQKIATGFNRNHRTNTEGGLIPAEFAAEYVVDRVATTSSVFLGLTMGCARCHDHKYDPLTQKEFYQLFAYFNNVPEQGHSRRNNTNPYITAPTPQQQSELDNMDRQIVAASAHFATLRMALESAESAWTKSIVSGPATDWAPTRGLVTYQPFNGNLNGIAKAKLEGAPAPQPIWKGDPRFSKGVSSEAASFEGNSFVEIGDVDDTGSLPIDELAKRRLALPADDRFTFSAWIFPTARSGAIITRTPDEPKEAGYSLQLRDGKLEMIVARRIPESALWIETVQEVELNRWHHVAVTKDGIREARGLKIFVDGILQPVKVLADLLNFPLAVKQPLRIGGGGGPENRFHGMIDEARVYDVELTSDEIGILSAAKNLNEISSLPSASRTKSESDKIRGAFLDSPAAPVEIRDAYRQLTTLQEQREQYYRSIQTVMVMEEMPAPRETHVLLRGAYDAPGEVVTPAVPAILPAMPQDLPRNRLGLARWLVNPSNPLTSRVAVNRFWAMYFGSGIVKTVDDFGSQGELPSHPELLDWLATEFVRSGWNVKALHKLIVTSATYRQASKATPELLQKDRENRLLARGARFRLPAETVRDQALSIAGLLTERVGGPSVKPYQPEGLWTDLTLDVKYVQDHGDQLYRRSLYTFWKRTIPPPSMANFDAPGRDSCIIQRGFTNSPLQALDLMNDVTYLEAARMLGERMMKEGGSTAQDRITFAFRLAVGKPPTAEQASILKDSLRFALDRFQSRPGSAAKYLSQGEHPRDPGLNADELAAYATVASLIVNLDEAVTKQ